MRFITTEEWRFRVAPLHLPTCFSMPLRHTYSRWKDTTDPLGSLLEVFKYAALAPEHDILPSVFTGQIIHESNYGLKQDALLGIKATAKDIENGTWRKLKTWERVTARQMEALKNSGDFIELIKARQDGLFDVSCWQRFHFEPGLIDDFELFFKVYKLHYEKYHKPKPGPGCTPRQFLETVTQAQPPYATDTTYTDKVMGVIKACDLESMDFAFEFEHKEKQDGKA